MPIGFLSKSDISVTDLAHGIRMADIPGDRGAVQSFILIISINGLTPGTFCSVAILSPTGTPLSNSGPADAFGDLSISTTWVRDTDDTHWLQVAHGAGVFPDGFWNLIITGNFAPIDNPSGGIDIQFGTEDVISYNSDLSDTPTNPTHGTPNWDGSKGNIDLGIDYANSSMEDPDSIAVVRDGAVVGTIPWVNGITSYTYTDVVFAAGTYTYSFFVYKYPNSRSADSTSFSADFGGVPTLELVMSGGFNMGGVMGFNFLVDPSGIYKLTPGLLHDELYNRADPLDITTENVAIPNPFIDTFFAGK